MSAKTQHPITAARKRRLMTQTQLAELLGVTQSRVAEYEGDVKIPTPESIVRVNQALGLGWELWLWYGLLPPEVAQAAREDPARITRALRRAIRPRPDPR